MATFAQVIHHNDEAVTHMLQGDIEVSNAKLRECFLMLKECLMNTAQADEDECDSNNESKKAKSLTASLSYVPSTSYYAVEALQDEDFFIYNRPVVFGKPMLASIAGESPIRTGRILSAGIIFNMALLCHVRARMGNLGSLIKAQKLYYNVVRLASNNDEDNEDERQPLFAIELGLAALNNYLQACLELGELEEAQQAASSLQAASGHLTQPQALLDACVWDAIMTNVLALGVSSTQYGGVLTLVACAPAA